MADEKADEGQGVEKETADMGAAEPGSDDCGTSGTGEGKGRSWRRGFKDRGWGRATKVWGFLGFCILVLILARHVVLPFVFALLLAFILAPVVRWLSVRPDGSKRFPKWAAILTCYLILLGTMTAFMFVLLPRLSKDAARIAREAPALYKEVDDEWVPRAAAWLEKRFPSLTEPTLATDLPPVTDPSLPPGTQFVITPLQDGRMAVQLEQTGIEIQPLHGGGMVLTPRRAATSTHLEGRLRTFSKDFISGMQGQLGDLFRAGQRLVAAVITSIFTFFLVLMIAAFIMLDLPRLHGFVRGLFPAEFQDDYDLIVRGIDRGLSGVIRGQLTICVVNGILTYVGLILFSIKYSLILATVAAVFSLVPIFGSILSTIPVVLVALVSGDAGLDVMPALLILAWIIGIHFFEANLLNPKIIGSAAKMHPVLVIFALVLGEHSFGLTGALLAVPTASIIQVLFLYFRHKTWRSEAVPC